MDLRAETADDGTLRRIIALLVALAALAERGASRSTAVRCLLIWLLRRAETAAAAFVLEATGVPPPFGGIAAAGNGSGDALRLAARFRALAAALGALLATAWPLGRRPSWRGRAIAPVPPRAGRRLGGRTQGPNDTS